jgi:hypothetical protein
MADKAFCHCCDKEVEFKELSQVINLANKLLPGEETPLGQCKECGALAYMTDDERRLQRASGLLQRDYWDDVRSLVEDLKDGIKDGHIEDQEQLQERLHEDCDGAGRVIYTHQAKLALVYSDNCDAYEEEYGGNMPNWSQLAYCALYRDVQDRLDPTTCEDCEVNFATTEHDGDSLCKECCDNRKEEDSSECA